MSHERAGVCAVLSLASTLLVGCVASDVPTAPVATQKAALHDGAWIGAEGGELRVGDYALSFPANALTEATYIEVRQLKALDWAVELSPHGIQFNRPETLTMDAEGDPDASVKRIYWFNTDTQTWEAQRSRVQGSAVSADLMHFSRYTLW
jgi:hypothetical protein